MLLIETNVCVSGPIRPYLLSLGEKLVVKAPGNVWRGVAGGLAGESDFFIELGGCAVAQVRDLCLDCEQNRKRVSESSVR